jgi:hypothetical protein
MQELETWEKILEERIRTKKSIRAVVSCYNKKVFIRFGRKQYSFEGSKQDAERIVEFLKGVGYSVLNHYEPSSSSSKDDYFCELKRIDFSLWTPPTS